MKRLDKKGFTIIEVLIVLAIAGLIMLVVFLAIPALQRSSRNNKRRSDLGKFYAAVEEYRANRNISNSSPFTGAGNAPDGSVNNASNQDNIRFEEFKTTLPSSSFNDYNMILFNGDQSSHTFTLEADDIAFFPWHFCSGDTVDSPAPVGGTYHTDKFIYAVLIGMENNFNYCLDNGRRN